MKNVFVDTNILVYAADESSPTSRKTAVAREVLLRPGIHFSVQVLSEFVANARHPRKLALTRERELRWLEGWLLRLVAPVGLETFRLALGIHARFQLSHWDSLIVASACELHCETLFSEDMNHGQDYDGVVAFNPFFGAD